MLHVQSADNVPPGGPEASPDAPRQANMGNSAKRERAVESLPKTQGTSADTAIVILEAEEEKDCQLDLVCSPLESSASGVLGGGPGVSNAGIPGEFSAAISRQWLCGEVG